MIEIQTQLGEDRSVCIVVFSPLSVDKDNPSFGWWKQLQNFNFSKVFVKDTLNTWYTSYDGILLNIEAIASDIKCAIESVCLKDDARLIFIGPSMGGGWSFFTWKYYWSYRVLGNCSNRNVNASGINKF